MSVYISEGYGGGPNLYTRQGEYICEGYASGQILATIRGNEIYFGIGAVHLVARVDGDKVYAGVGGGPAMYTIDGNKLYDNYGDGASVLISSEYDPMALAAAGCLRFGDESLRLSCEGRQSTSMQDDSFIGNKDDWFANKSDRDELMGKAGFGGGSDMQEADRSPSGDYSPSPSGDYSPSSSGGGYISQPTYEVLSYEWVRYGARYDELPKSSRSKLKCPRSIKKSTPSAEYWENKDWFDYYQFSLGTFYTHEELVAMMSSRLSKRRAEEREAYLAPPSYDPSLSPPWWHPIVGGILGLAIFFIWLYFFG